MLSCTVHTDTGTRQAADVQAPGTQEKDVERDRRRRNHVDSHARSRCLKNASDSVLLWQVEMMLVPFVKSM